MRRDPYWRPGGLASHIEFTRDGRLRRTPPPGEQVPAWPDATLTWRWARFGAGHVEAAPRGALLRCHVEDAPVPTYAVRRHPDTWGWIMESCWGVYSSFEPPSQDEDPFMNDDNLVVTANVQFREAFAYNAGFPLDEDDVAATNAAALTAALSSGHLAAEAVTVRSAAAAAAREWRAVPAEDALGDLIYIGAVALGHADRGDGGRVSHVLLPRRAIRDFMRAMGFGVPAAGVPGAMEAAGAGGGDWVVGFEDGSEDDSEDD